MVVNAVLFLIVHCVFLRYRRYPPRAQYDFEISALLCFEAYLGILPPPLPDPPHVAAREMMAQAEPAFQVEMQRMMEHPGGSLIAFAPHRTRCE